MYAHDELTNPKLAMLIRTGKILCAGNRKLRIYGTLRCGSGKRMKRENRVFFENTGEAEAMGYRPCGNCMRQKKEALDRITQRLCDT